MSGSNMKQFLLNRAGEYLTLAYAHSILEDWDTVDTILDKADFITSLVEEWEKEEERNNQNL